MTYIADLELCEYESTFQQTYPGCLAIGWLEEGHDYSINEEILDGFIEALKYIIENSKPNMIFQYFGIHDCELCHKDKEKTKALSRQEFIEKYGDGTKYEKPQKIIRTEDSKRHHNIFIHGKNDIVYAAPELLLHYVVDHGYVPPMEFQESVFLNLVECQKHENFII